MQVLEKATTGIADHNSDTLWVRALSLTCTKRRTKVLDVGCVSSKSKISNTCSSICSNSERVYVLSVMRTNSSTCHRTRSTEQYNACLVRDWAYPNQISSLVCVLWRCRSGCQAMCQFCFTCDEVFGAVNFR